MRPKSTMPCLAWLYWLLCYLWASMTPSGQGVFVGLGFTFLFIGFWAPVLGIIIAALLIDLVILTLSAMFSVTVVAKKKTANMIAERRWRIQQRIAEEEENRRKEEEAKDPKRRPATPEEIAAEAEKAYLRRVAIINAMADLDDIERTALINEAQEKRMETLRGIGL